MNRNIKIHCVNNGKTFEVPICSNLMDIYKATGLNMEYGPISAIVNNKEKSLVYECYKDKLVRFLDLTNPSALRTYTRTVLMILCKVVSDIFPDGRIIIENPVSKGIYCRLVKVVPLPKTTSPQSAPRCRRLSMPTFLSSA